MTWWFLLSTILLLGPVVGNDQDPLVVPTTSGLVRGERLESELGKKVDMWASIPFADPPIGNLRFRAPRPKSSWTGERDVRSPANCCQQIKGYAFPGNFSGEKVWFPNTKLSEDCLYLMVAKPVVNRGGKIPVMVWIYGGSFYGGTMTLDLYDPKIFAGEQEVIVVSIQYRVASLGFMYLGTDDVAGNAGLLDQLMALRWIKENIANFGGDPDSITLFSESAGSASVAFHLLSPLSRDLFNRAILQSASAINPWALITKNEAKRRALHLARKMNCPIKEPLLDITSQTINCLRRVDGNAMVNMEWDYSTGPPLTVGICAMPFVPIVDGEFLPDDPHRLLEMGNFKKTQILVGANKDEGHYFLLYTLTDIFKVQENITLGKEDFDKSTMEVNLQVKPVGLAAIKFMYTNWMDPMNSSTNVEAMDRMTGDYHFTCPVVNFANYYASSSPPNNVYFYYFTHQTVNSPWPKWTGVMHGDEIAFIFGDPFRQSTSPIQYTDEERNMSRTIMTFWSNFAVTGDPNKFPDGLWVPSIGGNYWPIHSAKNKEYLEINIGNKSREGNGLRAKECAFWTSYLPNLLKKAEEPPKKPKTCVCKCPPPVPQAPPSSVSVSRDVGCNCPSIASAPSPGSLVLSALLVTLASLLLLGVVL